MSVISHFTVNNDFTTREITDVCIAKRDSVNACKAIAMTVEQRLNWVARNVNAYYGERDEESIDLDVNCNNFITCTYYCLLAVVMVNVKIVKDAVKSVLNVNKRFLNCYICKI